MDEIIALCKAELEVYELANTKNGTSNLFYPILRKKNSNCLRFVKQTGLQECDIITKVADALRSNYNVRFGNGTYIFERKVPCNSMNLFIQPVVMNQTHSSKKVPLQTTPAISELALIRLTRFCLKTIAQMFASFERRKLRKKALKPFNATKRINRKLKSKEGMPLLLATALHYEIVFELVSNIMKRHHFIAVETNGNLYFSSIINSDFDFCAFSIEYEKIKHKINRGYSQSEIQQSYEASNGNDSDGSDSDSDNAMGNTTVQSKAMTTKVDGSTVSIAKSIIPLNVQFPIKENYLRSTLLNLSEEAKQALIQLVSIYVHKMENDFSKFISQSEYQKEGKPFRPTSKINHWIKLRSKVEHQLLTNSTLYPDVVGQIVLNILIAHYYEYSQDQTGIYFTRKLKSGFDVVSFNMECDRLRQEGSQPVPPIRFIGKVDSDDNSCHDEKISVAGIGRIQSNFNDVTSNNEFVVVPIIEKHSQVFGDDSAEDWHSVDSVEAIVEKPGQVDSDAEECSSVDSIELEVSSIGNNMSVAEVIDSLVVSCTERMNSYFSIQVLSGKFEACNAKGIIFSGLRREPGATILANAEISTVEAVERIVDALKQKFGYFKRSGDPYFSVKPSDVADQFKVFQMIRKESIFGECTTLLKHLNAICSQQINNWFKRWKLSKFSGEVGKCPASKIIKGILKHLDQELLIDCGTSIDALVDIIIEPFKVNLDHIIENNEQFLLWKDEVIVEEKVDDYSIVLVNNTSIPENWEDVSVPTLISSEDMKKTSVDKIDVLVESLTTAVISEAVEEVKSEELINIEHFGMLAESIEDTNVFFNPLDPFCLLTVGSQNCGRSSTVASLINNFIVACKLLKVQKQLSLVFYRSFLKTSVCDLVKYLPLSGSAVHSIPITVLVSPHNYPSRCCQYKPYNVNVKPLMIQWKELQPHHIMSIMQLEENSELKSIQGVLQYLQGYQRKGIPLPKFQEFLENINKTCIFQGEGDILRRRIRKLESIILESGINSILASSSSSVLQLCQQSGLIIVDLTDPLLSDASSDIIAQVLADQFTEFTEDNVDSKKLLVLDDADTLLQSNNSNLLHSVLSASRAMYHTNMRIILSCLDVEFIPWDLVKVCNAAVVHQLNSQASFDYIAKYVPFTDVAFKTIVHLKQGHTLSFCRSHSTVFYAIKDDDSDTKVDIECDSSYGINVFPIVINMNHD